MRTSDVYPGVVNCVLKGVGVMLTMLLPHAGAQGRQSALVLAVRRANVDCAMRTLDVIMKTDGRRSWRPVERAVERAVGEIDNQGKGLGKMILTRTMENGTERWGEDQGDLDWKRILLKLATKGAKVAVQMVTGIMEEVDVKGRQKIYNGAAVKAIHKGRVEALSSLLLLMKESERNISALLSQCAAKNEVNGCKTILETGIISKGDVERAVAVAKGKGAEEVLKLLKNWQE